MTSFYWVAVFLLYAYLVEGCPANAWSAELIGRQWENSPSQPCLSFKDPRECRMLNFCCFEYNECIPANPSFIECVSITSPAPCNQNGINCFWDVESSLCLRACPFTNNANLLCVVLGRLSLSRTVSPTAVVAPTLTPLSNLPTLTPSSKSPTSKSPSTTKSPFHTPQPVFPSLTPTTIVWSQGPTNLPSTTNSPTSSRPTKLPSQYPTKTPTANPSSLFPTTASPFSRSPSSFTVTSTPSSTWFPSFLPTSSSPTFKVVTSNAPSSGFPSVLPTTSQFPTSLPTSLLPTRFPTVNPSSPTSVPTMASKFPSALPTSSQFPSALPISSQFPSALPASSQFPSALPTSSQFPSALPTSSQFPSALPTSQFPSALPTSSQFPTSLPLSNAPTHFPTAVPTLDSKYPSPLPNSPTRLPSLLPSSLFPTLFPSMEMTAKPSPATFSPSLPRTASPVSPPTSLPTSFPNSQTNVPSLFPSNSPTVFTRFPSNSKFPTKKPLATTSFPSAAGRTFSPVVSWAPGLVSERNPQELCASFFSQQKCAMENFCCWEEGSCFTPALPEVDCASIFDQQGCQFMWGKDCMWNDAVGICTRRLPAITNRVSPQQLCQKASLAYQENTLQPSKRFTPLVSSALMRSSATTYSALNSLKQYCWAPDLQEACQFPFEYQNRNYYDCMALPGKEAMCLTANSRVWSSCKCTQQRRKRSVVLIALDDFRPEAKLAYGRKSAKTPVLDDFAQRQGTVVFDRAYAQFSWCSPSRDSFLSSLYPDTTQSYSFEGEGLSVHPYRKKFTTLPELFKTNGYYTTGGGKIFHLNREDPQSWNDYYSLNEGQNNACKLDPKSKLFELLDGKTSLGCLTQEFEALMDVQLVNRSLHKLEQIVQQEQEPFFLALGLYKPHTPYHIHETYWNLFETWKELEDFNLFGPVFPVSSFKEELTFNPGENEYSKYWTGSVFAKKTNRAVMYFRYMMRRGYFAAVAQSDDLIGRVLNKIDDLGLRQSTMVVIVGDHGFALGENNVFAKQTNFEVATRVPLIMHVPWLRTTAANEGDNAEKVKPKTKGANVLGKSVSRFQDFFELVDLLPTISGFMGLSSALSRKVYQGRDQSTLMAASVLAPSLVNQLDSLSRDCAFSQVMRCTLLDCTFAPLNTMYAVGYSVRTKAWRYTVFLTVIKGQVQWNQPSLSHELYSHANDKDTIFAYDNDGANGALFGGMELENVAEKQAAVCAQMFLLIRHQFDRNNPLLV